MFAFVSVVGVVIVAVAGGGVTVAGGVVTVAGGTVTVVGAVVSMVTADRAVVGGGVTVGNRRQRIELT